jgi:restriction system protein
MIDYTDPQIYSIGILLFFFYFIVMQIRSWFSKSYAVEIKLLPNHTTLKSLKALSWQDFERLCMELFSQMGWGVRGNGGEGADGGVDIWLEKEGFNYSKTKAIVQCKRYRNSPVGVKVIREMYGLKHEYGVDEVYIVTTSYFTKEAKAFVKGKEMRLIDGKKLVGLIGKYIP